MKNVGFIRKADSPGRIVIPKEICKIPGFDADSLSFVHWQDRQLIFEEYQKTRAFCGACTAPPEGEPLAKRGSFPFCQSLPSLGATTTTAASRGNSSK